MNLKNYASIFYFLLFSVTLYILHRSLFYVLGTDIDPTQFHYNLEFLYAFFAGMGLLIILSLKIVLKSSPDFVGMAFLVATNINLIFSYIVVRPILSKTTGDVKIEKINFFVIFIIFLAMEIVMTAKMLINSRKNGENSKLG